jgi:hypothetical protein
MARIIREADDQPIVPQAAPAMRQREQRISISILVAHVALIGATVYAWLAAGRIPDLTAPLIGRGRLTLIPMEPGIALTIGAALTVLLLSLFGAVREVRYTDRR